MHVPESTRNLKISAENLMTSFNDIREAVKTIWDHPLLQHYTNHGLDHSERIIEKLDNLLEGQTNPLNEHESFILLASVYLHDVGMQSPSHAGLPCRSEYTIRDLEIVRKKHNEVSAKMIMDSVSRNRNLSLGLERCKEHVGFVATLSKYHRKLDINEVKNTSIAGKEIKLRLLTALLRLGDALDQDYRRVNMEILKLRDIPVQSKFYWWSHHYLSSILVKAGRIELYFRFPEEYRSDKIIEVFRGKVSESVRDQFLEVYDVLDNYGIRLYRDVVIQEESYAPEGALMLVPDDLLEYIKEYILKPKESSQELGALESLETLGQTDKSIQNVARVIRIGTPRLSGQNHFYTTSGNERNDAINVNNYRDENIACYVFSTQHQGSVPLYRLYNPATHDHFYTTSSSERNKAISHYGYRDENISCYVYDSPTKGSIPLYRLYWHA